MTKELADLTLMKTRPRRKRADFITYKAYCKNQLTKTLLILLQRYTNTPIKKEKTETNPDTQENGIYDMAHAAREERVAC